jgi:hypothetical protein
VVVHLHDVADDGQGGRTLHDPAYHAGFHLLEVVRSWQIHDGLVEVQRHGWEYVGVVIVVVGELEARLESILVSRSGKPCLEQDCFHRRRVCWLREVRQSRAGVEDHAVGPGSWRCRIANGDAVQFDE